MSHLSQKTRGLPSSPSSCRQTLQTTSCGAFSSVLALAFAAELCVAESDVAADDAVDCVCFAEEALSPPAEAGGCGPAVDMSSFSMNLAPANIQRVIDGSRSERTRKTTLFQVYIHVCPD